MFLSELLWRAAGLRRSNTARRGKLIRKEQYRMGRSTKGLVAIPNKIRKKMSGAER